MIREYLLPGWLLTVQICITLGFILTLFTLGALALVSIRWPLKTVLQYEWMMTKMCYIATLIASKSDLSILLFMPLHELDDEFPYSCVIFGLIYSYRRVNIPGNRDILVQCLSARLDDVPQIQHCLLVIWAGSHRSSNFSSSIIYFATRIITGI